MTATYDNIIQHLNRPDDFQPAEDTAPDYEFKKQIVLNFDRLDLARKLEEMTKSVNEMKNHWQGTGMTCHDQKSENTDMRSAGAYQQLSPRNE